MTAPGDVIAEEHSAAPHPSLLGWVGLFVEKYGVIVAWVAVIVFFSVMRPDTFAQTATIRLILSTQTVVLGAALALMITLAVGELDL